MRFAACPAWVKINTDTSQQVLHLYLNLQAHWPAGTGIPIMKMNLP